MARDFRSGIWPFKAHVASQERRDYDVSIVKLGRYEQRVPNSVDPVLRLWDIVVEIPEEDEGNTRDFLDGRFGVLPFLFEDPVDGKLREVVCDSWTMRPRAGSNRVLFQAQFREVSLP